VVGGSKGIAVARGGFVGAGAAVKEAFVEDRGGEEQVDRLGYVAEVGDAFKGGGRDLVDAWRGHCEKMIGGIEGFLGTMGTVSTQGHEEKKVEELRLAMQQEIDGAKTAV